MKRLLSVCFALLIVVFSGTTVAAEEGHASSRLLPPQFLIGDEDGIHVDYTGEYGINARHLLPGDVIRKTLTIQNLDTGGEEASIPYELKMRVEPLSVTGPVDLLSETHLTLTLDGEVIYSGKMRGDDDSDMIINALNLGTYQSGDQRQLEMLLEVNPAMEVVMNEKSEAFLSWYFSAVRIDDGAVPPNTGWTADSGIYIGLIAGMCLLMAALVIRKRQRDQQIQALQQYYYSA
jgi:hypothetical protein